MTAAILRTVQVEHGDCLDVMPRLVADGVTVDAVVTDPPYHLKATQKRFGAEGSAPAQYGRDGAMNRLSSGFMGQKWDGGDIAFRPETWAIVATIMRPGAFLVAFGGTRTYHRLVSAIEDAGFVIQDQIAWLFGSGFPKHKAQLKPAHEPICLAYKPGGKRTMQVDECRIATSDALGGGDSNGASHGKAEGWDRPWMTNPEHRKRHAEKVRINVDKAEALGRWPANVAHDGSDELLAAFAPFGERKTGDGVFKRQSGSDRNGNQGAVYGAENRPSGTPMPCYGDTGSAARFFFSAKANKDDRWGSRHPTVKPVDMIRWLVTLVTPPGGTFLDPFAGSGAAAVAALASGRKAILIEREAAYVADIRERIAYYEGEGRHSMVAKNRARPEVPTGSLL